MPRLAARRPSQKKRGLREVETSALRVRTQHPSRKRPVGPAPRWREAFPAKPREVGTQRVPKASAEPSWRTRRPLRRRSGPDLVAASRRSGPRPSAPLGPRECVPSRTASVLRGPALSACDARPYCGMGRGTAPTAHALSLRVLDLLTVPRCAASSLLSAHDMFHYRQSH